MPSRRNNSDNSRKPFKKKDGYGSDSDSKKYKGKPEFKRSSKPKSFDRNSNDPNELAPPRFIAREDKPSYKKRSEDPRNSSRPYNDRRKSSFDRSSDEFGKKKFPKAEGRGPRFDSRKDARPDGPDKRGNFSSEDRKPYSRGKSFEKDSRGRNSNRPFDQENRGGNFKTNGDEIKRPFKPKYDPEVKNKKSFRDRKNELLGVTDSPDDIRLNKYIANSGVCSRREADSLIEQGLVTVDGKVVTEMGYRVKKGEVVKYDGQKILPEPFVYILMNKPKDFITTTDDDKGRKTVLDLLADKVPQRIYPIGRLDRNTTGVLLLTNDGDVAQALSHPSYQVKKIYHVVLDKKVSGTDLDKLVEGVELEDGLVHADTVAFVDNEDRRHVGVEIHSGKNRVVRRMFEHLGYEVEKLDRVSMGIFTKKDLPRGKWRYLNQSEVGFLSKLKANMAKLS
ncbi:MAG: pseudouridine synthase [Bacteroidia bacterium]